MVGTVVRVLPSTLINPNDLTLPETSSLISVDQVISGTLPNGTNTIAISEVGGKVGLCELVIPDNPLVKLNEKYVLFLFADKQNVPPNTTGSPRYNTVGHWSGKARITDGKINFLPSASQGLRKYDNVAFGDFTETVRARARSLLKRTP